MPQTAQPFDARNLSGVWQFASGGGGQGPGDNFPPLTPWGQAKYDANKPGYGPKAAPGGNDPILKCDPTGFPRILFQIWPFEIIQLPGLLLILRETNKSYREIFTDGRPLPDANCDVLISDIGLPDGNGWELMTKLGAERPPYAIAMSGFGMSSDRQRSLNVGYRHHLLKPVEPNQLERLLDEAADETGPRAGRQGAA